MWLPITHEKRRVVTNMSDEELPSTSREVHSEKEEVKRARQTESTVHDLFADGREKQDAEVCSLSAFGGNGTWREGCSVHKCTALDI